MLQFQDVSRPQPEIWSPMALPTRPVKNPTIGPNAIAEERHEREGRPDANGAAGIGIWATSRIP